MSETLEAMAVEQSLQESDHQLQMNALHLESILDAAESLEGIREFCSREDTPSSASLEAYQQTEQCLLQHPVVSLSLEKVGKFSEYVSGEKEAPTRTEYFIAHIKQTLAQIWNAVYEFVMRGVRFLTDFLSKMVTGIDGMLRKFDKLEKRVEEVKKGNPVEPQQEIRINGGLRLHRAGNVTPSGLLGGLRGMHTAVKIAVDYHLEGSEKIVEELQSLTKQLTRLDADKAEAFGQQILKLKEIPGEYSGILTDIAEGRSKLVENDYDSFNQKELPGGKRLTVHPVEYDRRGMPKNMPRFELSAFNDKIRNKEITDAEVGSPAQLQQIIQEARNLLENMQKQEQKITTISEEYKTAVENKNQYLKRDSVRRILNDELSNQQRTTFLAFYGVALPGDVTRMIRYQYSVARATVGYVDQCLRYYEKRM